MNLLHAEIRAEEDRLREQRQARAADDLAPKDGRARGEFGKPPPRDVLDMLPPPVSTPTLA